MPYNFFSDSFHTKKLCSRLSSSKVRFYTENGRFALFVLPLANVPGPNGTMFLLALAHWKAHAWTS